MFRAPEGFQSFWNSHLVVGNGDLNLYTWFDVDRGDLTDDFRGRVQVNDSLVDSHLEDKEIAIRYEGLQELV